MQRSVLILPASRKYKFLQVQALLGDGTGSVLDPMLKRYLSNRLIWRLLWDVVVIQGQDGGAQGGRTAVGVARPDGFLTEFEDRGLEFADRFDVGCESEGESEKAPWLPAQAAGRRQPLSAKLGELCALGVGHVASSRMEFS